MSTLDSFLPYVRPWAPGVPDTTAYKNIRFAIIEFCERTRLWKLEDDYDVTEAECNGPITTPSGSILHDIEIVMFNGAELRPEATRDLDRLEPKWRTDAPTGLPKYYTQIDQSTLRVVPAQAGHLYLCLRLKPAADATTIPDFIAAEYAECIGWGALGRILTVPGQSYTSPDLGQFYAQKFSEKLDRLTLKGSTGQQNARKRTRASFY